MDSKKSALIPKVSDIFTGTKYCISVDGSKFSDYGFELIFNDMFMKGDRIVVVHISNSEKVDNIPFQYKPDTIQNKYDTKLVGKLVKSEYAMVIQPKERNVAHAMEQVYKISTANKCNVLVMGYQGHKSDYNKKDITKGTVFMIENIRIPTFIVKDNTKRINKQDGSFSWFIGIENSSSQSFKAFEYSLRFIDLKKDKVVILHIKQFNVTEEELVETEIKNFCAVKKITNAEIRIIENDNTPIGKQICNFINYGQENFDFIVVSHNSDKYRNLESSPLVEICKNAQANILYYCNEQLKKSNGLLDF